MTLKRILMLLIFVPLTFVVCLADEGAGRNERNLLEEQDGSVSEKHDGAKDGKPTGINMSPKFTYTR